MATKGTRYHLAVGASAVLPNVFGQRRTASGLDPRPISANHSARTSAVFEMGRIFLSDRCRPAREPKIVPALASPSTAFGQCAMGSETRACGAHVIGGSTKTV